MFRKTQKHLAITLSMAMLFTSAPVYALTAEPSDNLCEHHAAHDEACGYLAEVDEIPCSHSHTEACCIAPAPESGDDATLACTHTVHDEACGYMEASAGADCTFLCEVCAQPEIFNPPVKDSVEPEKSSAVIALGASSLTGITVDNDFGGPPPMAARCATPNGKVSVTPVVDGDDAGGVTYAWYYTHADNITDGANNTYSVTNPNSGTSLNHTVSDYTAKDSDFGNYLYCNVSLGDNSITSSAFKVVSAPALIGDLIIDYKNNSISALLEQDGESSLMSPDGYGANMASDGEFRIDVGNETVESKKPTYSNGLLSATFETNFSELDSFAIVFFHPNYFGIRRESGGKVPTDIILPGVPSVIITLFGGDGNGQIALTDTYVQNVIAKVAAANSGKKIVLVMRADSNKVDLTADVLGAVAAGDALYADIDSAKLTINKELLTELDGKNGTVAISAERATVPNNANDEAKAAIGDRPVVDLSITADSTPVTEFAGEGKVTVSIPYALANGERVDDLVIYYIKDDGTTEAITDVTYANGFISFITGHFSKFAVGYRSSNQGGGSTDGGSTGGSSTDGGSTGGGSSGGGSTIAAPPLSDKPNTPINGEAKVESKVDATGKVTVTVPEKSVTDAIKAAQDAAKKAGTTADGISVTVSVITDKAASSIAATLPQNAVNELVRAGAAELRIESRTANLSLDLATLKQIQATGGGNVTVSANAVKHGTLSKAAQAAIGSRPVYDLSIMSGGKAVTSFGSVSVALPYTLGANEKPGNLCGVYVDANGKVSDLISSSYDSTAKTLRFSTNHFSTFGIGYKAEMPVFTDTMNHWAKDDIDFVVARGLLNGPSATAFCPGTGMTRGMFVTALGRLAGIDSTKYTAARFTDVAVTSYYAPFAAWAAEKGIISGTSATTFSPDQTITRQELAVFMQDYAEAIGYTVPKTREAVEYVDAAFIGSFEKDAVKAMQMAGVMNGKNDNQFDPTGTATRAEAAAMLHRYVELVIDIRTAQGPDVNDSGSAIIYETGKLVKSVSRTTG